MIKTYNNVYQLWTHLKDFSKFHIQPMQLVLLTTNWRRHTAASELYSLIRGSLEILHSVIKMKAIYKGIYIEEFEMEISLVN